MLEGIGNNGSYKPPAAKPDLSGIALKNYMDLLNAPGQMVGGSAGHTVSRAGGRAASQAAYNQANADRQKVYDQATAAVTERNPGIQQAYDTATADIRANARQRAIDDATRLQALQTQATEGARNLGLQGIAAPSATTRTQAENQAQEAKFQQNAESWAGFNGGAAQRAIASNNAVGDAFTWQGAQQQAVLAALLQKAILAQPDVYVPGSAGHLVGAPTMAQKLAGYNNLLNFSSKDFNNDLSAAKFKQSTKQATINNDRQDFVTQAKYGLPASFLKR